MVQLIILDPADSVAVTPTELASGEEAMLPDGKIIRALQVIPRGHKISIRPVPCGGTVVKYGHSIGMACTQIENGEWVHTHNLHSTIAGELDYSQSPATPAAPLPHQPPQGLRRTFMGYRREDGLAGTRNQIWIIPTVGCVNGIATRLAVEGNTLIRERMYGHGRLPAETGTLPLPENPEILENPDFPEVLALTHPYGCSQLGDDLAFTKRILASLARHPNTAGVLILGLGCENNLLDAFLEEIGSRPAGTIESVRLQDEADEEAAALAALGRLASRAAGFSREEIPVSELTLGLKCGGSDGFSGITANPLAGLVADWLVAEGGSVLLTEVPEMFGAEDSLLARASSSGVWKGTIDLVNHWKAYFLSHGQGSHENPSPGNRDGGITTIEEKSLGCVRKAGTSPVKDILPYGGRRKLNGLSLVSGPGNDLVSSTALAAAGASLIIFTTGRGTPFGSVVPTIKVSTTTALAMKKPRWIDWDAGPMLEGIPMGNLAESLWNHLLDTASGKPTKSEEAGCREIAIFKDGVTL